MSNKLDCHIVKDLLPLYADGLTSEETSRDIKGHLNECKDCNAQYAAMTGQILEEEKTVQEQEEKEIDYLKKVKKRSKRTALIVACAAVIVLAALGLRFFVIGNVDKQAIISAEVEGTREIYYSAQTSSSALAIAKIDVSENDGIITITARTVPVGIFRKDIKGWMYTASSDIKRILDASGTILWENGVSINDNVGRMYANRVQYVGDAPAVSKLVYSVWFPGLDLNINRNTGIQLVTDAQPYGLILNTDTYASKDRIIRHASLLLALIDNLDYVEYHLRLSEKVYNTVKITSEDAIEAIKILAQAQSENNEPAKAALAADSIKDLGKSAYSLQMLTDLLSNNLDVNLSERPQIDIDEAMARLGLSLEENVSIVTSVTTYSPEAWTTTVDFSNGDMLLVVYNLDGTLFSTNYFDRYDKLLYTLMEGGEEGLTVREI